MRAFLIGNSIVRDLNGRGFSTICLPGADWKEIIEYVKDRRTYFSYSIVYIHIGPVRFTRMHRTANRREVQLITNNVGTVEGIMEDWSSLKRSGIFPVLCTLYPMDFRQYNDSLARRIRDGRQILQSFYDDNTKKIRGMIVEENKSIIRYNNQNEMCTPFMHNQIYTRRRGYYHFRARLLRDGLHPSRYITSRWINELERVVTLNRTKLEYRWGLRPGSRRH